MISSDQFQWLPSTASISGQLKSQDEDSQTELMSLDPKHSGGGFQPLMSDPSGGFKGPEAPSSMSKFNNTSFGEMMSVKRNPMVHSAKGGAGSLVDFGSQ